MGCDIHYVIERKRKGDEKWLGIYATDFNQSPPHEWSIPLPKNRNYMFFGEIANVRSTSSKGDAADPKGIPDDASDLSLQQIEAWDSDGHSHSYLSAEEFCADYIKCYELQEKSLDAFWVPRFIDPAAPAERVAEEMEKRKKAKEVLESVKASPLYYLLGVDDGDVRDNYYEVRVVFWFDN